MQQLLYKSDSFSLDILANLKLLALQFGDVTSVSTEQTGMLTPVVGLSVATIGLLGVYALLRARHTVLSYTLFSWTLLLTPFFILNPDSFALLMVPTVLFLALGISLILQYWYQLFPKNPYARIFALVPTSILFSCIIIPSALHYFYSYSYFAPLANTHHNDLELVADTLESNPNAPLIVTTDEAAFYRIYLDTHETTHSLITIAPDSPTDIPSSPHNTAVATRDAAQNFDETPSYIVANSTRHAASDRFYIYKMSQE